MQIAMACMFIAAVTGIILYGMRQTIIINRRWALTRNVDWAIEHGSYVEKLLNPSFLPFITATLVAIVPIIWAAVQKPTQLLECYIGGIFGGLLLLTLIYVPVEILISRKIPKPEIRIAKLAPRTLSSYVRPLTVITALVLTLLIAATDILYYVKHVLTLHHFICNVIIHTATFGSIIAAIISVLMERPIHHRSIDKISNIDIYEVARKWAVYIIAGGYYLVIITFAIQLVGQWFGYEHSYPVVKFLHEQMNATVILKPMFSKDLHTTIAAIEGVLLVPVLYLILNSKPIKILASLKFSKKKSDPISQQAF